MPRWVYLPLRAAGDRGRAVAQDVPTRAPRLAAYAGMVRHASHLTQLGEKQIRMPSASGRAPAVYPSRWWGKAVGCIAGILNRTMQTPQDHYIQVGHINARYWIENGHGSLVILIHGLGGFVESWLLAFDVLVARHRVYAVDLPGHGRTYKPLDGPC